MPANTRDEILTATRQLVALMIRRNGIEARDVASTIFTTTPDLDAEFPALAARQLGWLEVPLLCGPDNSLQPTSPPQAPLSRSIAVFPRCDPSMNVVRAMSVCPPQTS